MRAFRLPPLARRAPHAGHVALGPVSAARRTGAPLQHPGPRLRRTTTASPGSPATTTWSTRSCGTPSSAGRAREYRAESCAVRPASSADAGQPSRTSFFSPRGRLTARLPETTADGAERGPVATPAVSRRDFLRVGVGSTVVAASVLTLGPSAFAETATVATFTLSPTSTAQCDGPRTGCTSCRACRQHATNKLFRSTDAAGAGRAHQGCLCAVAPGPPVSAAAFAVLFGDSTPSVDRRDPRHRGGAHAGRRGQCERGQHA